MQLAEKRRVEAGKREDERAAQCGCEVPVPEPVPEPVPAPVPGARHTLRVCVCVLELDRGGWENSNEKRRQKIETTYPTYGAGDGRPTTARFIRGCAFTLRLSFRQQ